MVPATCKGPCKRNLMIWDLDYDGLCSQCRGATSLRRVLEKHSVPKIVVEKPPMEFDPGFHGPEPGSADRYAKRVRERPWLSHTVWWLVHNCVSHPLIGVLPVRPLFEFHDWTSRKMHGR